jgi:membrane-associated protease RseP (regulator of RpoE activity)
MAEAVDAFRDQNRAGLDPQDEPREFYRLTPGKKMIVMLGGPAMNLFIFLVLMIGLLGLVGVAHDEPTTTVATVSKCIVPANATQQQVDACTQVNSPAALAGFKPGDRFVSVDGVAVRSWDDVVAKVENSAGRRLSIVVDRGGQQVVLTPTPVENTKYASDTGTATKRAGFLGLGPTNHHYYTPMSFTKIPSEIGSEIGQGLSAVGSYPKKISNLWQTVFDGKPRDPEGAIGVVGIGRIGGEIADTNQFDLQDKIVMLVSLLASVNLLLFFFNLIPLLPLDGGHVAGAIVEAGRRGVARMRGRSSRIFVDTSTMLPITYGVTLVLVAMTVLTLYADIVHPVQLFG